VTFGSISAYANGMATVIPHAKIPNKAVK